MNLGIMKNSTTMTKSFSHNIFRWKSVIRILKHKVPITILVIIFFSSLNIFASLSSHPSSFKETVIKGNIQKVELHISNSLSTPLGYSFSIPNSWVKLSSVVGSIDGNATITIVVSLDASNLEEGKYTTNLLLGDPHHGAIPIPIELTVNTATDVQEDKSIPSEFKLNQNYPNPFNPSTTISFSIPVEQNVSLIVYDVLGKEVAELVNNFLKPGYYNFQFSAVNSQLSSGIYFYTIKTDSFIQTKKMLLIK